jgi:ribosome biogenesis GTPase / thiamine phosphate phosphatase
MNKFLLKKYGLGPKTEAEASLFPDLFTGRVLSQTKDLYKVVSENGILQAKVSGKFRFEAKRASDFPAVGDFVMMDRSLDLSGDGIISTVLTRKSAFIRKAAGTANDEQVVAANIDTVFICMSLNSDFNLRRIERYLSIAWDSGATPVIVLTKADLCSDLPEKLRAIGTVAIGVEILVASSLSADGYESVKKYIEDGKTIAFIGSSGVGKSTLIDKLAGGLGLATKSIRKDDKGRHATTRRELILLRDGGIVIDTPGMRELGLEGADLSLAFADIDALAEQCRFSDCSHNGEPGCAVRLAILDGQLSDDRLESYRKLQKEAKYDGLNAKQIETEKFTTMFASMGGMKNVRKLIKEKNRNR